MSTDNCELGSVLINSVCGSYRMYGVVRIEVSNLRVILINADVLQDIISSGIGVDCLMSSFG